MSGYGISSDQATYRLSRALGVDSEMFHLGRATAAYVLGRIDIEEFEPMVEHVLRGGYLGESLQLRDRTVK